MKSKKEKVMLVITIIICLAIAACCIAWYNIATNNSNNDVIDNEEEKEEAIFTKEDYPRVDASLAIHPLVDSIAANFLAVSEDELDYEYTTGRSSDVYANLIDGNVDVIFAAPISDMDKDYAKSKNVELEITPATSSAFVFVVNKDNKVDNLTIEQIQKIYSGEITNWKEVGGDDEPIIAYQRPQGSGSQTAMVDLVMKDVPLKDPEVFEIESEMSGLINAVAEYDNAINALGYSYFYYVNTMYKNENIKMIKVNGVEPTIDTIKNGKYPIYTNGFIVTRKDKDENTTKWVNEVLGKRGSKIITEAGYVPLN